MASAPRNAFASSRVPFVALAAVVFTGCTLVVPSLRPVPGAERNLTCVLEYRPDPAHDGPDLLFAAVANPYALERAYMNPLEALVHNVFGPGRHLSEAVEVRGAVCSSPWQAGYRVPMWLDDRHYLLCRRRGLDDVSIAVRTKWGACEQRISAGDDRPRCRRWTRPNEGLRSLSDAVCSGSAAGQARRESARN